ncbi:hypothetical protein SAMN05660816_03457 [Niastella yeongjuensis]|nr:hypothetical protein SAMN05660816_03457 [Niastella yeongjuensis]
MGRIALDCRTECIGYLQRITTSETRKTHYIKKGVSYFETPFYYLTARRLIYCLKPSASVLISHQLSALL